MIKYTIGIVFNPSLSSVILILKQKPDWQKGKYNFPGGKLEEGETPQAGIYREFKEETGLDIGEWNHIGQIIGPDYTVEVLTQRLQKHKAVKQLTDEEPSWKHVGKLPRNTIHNIKWLVGFAKEWHCSTGLQFGTFSYL